MNLPRSQCTGVRFGPVSVRLGVRFGSLVRKEFGSGRCT